jgi:hypothetical protein
VKGDDGFNQSDIATVVGTRKASIVVDDHRPVAICQGRYASEHAFIVALAEPSMGEPIDPFPAPPVRTQNTGALLVGCLRDGDRSR